MSARTALTATGVGVTLLLAGCGSGGSGSAGSGSTGASTGTQPTSAAPAGSQQPSASSGDTSSGSSGATTPTSSAPGDSSSTGAGSRKTATAQPPAVAPSGSKSSSSKSSGSASAGAKPVALCAVGQLRISVVGGDADMQGAHRSLVFKNVGNKVCKLTGAPGVSFVAGDGGRQVGLPAERIVGHQPVVLIPNATASAGLFISSAPRKSDCSKVTARGLRVFPPDSYKSAYVPLSEVTCSSKSQSYLKVGPILPGTGHRV